MKKVKKVLKWTLTWCSLTFMIFACEESGVPGGNFPSEIKLSKNQAKLSRIQTERQKGTGDPFQINSIKIKNDNAEINVTYKGSSKRHTFEIITSDNPENTGIAMVHSSNEDTDQKQKTEILRIPRKNLFSQLKVDESIQFINGSNNQDVGLGYDKEGYYFNNKVTFIKDESRFEKLKSKKEGDLFKLEKANIDKKNNLVIVLSYSGGCADHSWEVVWNGKTNADGSLTLYVVHDSAGDLCQAYFTEKASWNISQITGQLQLQDKKITLINASNGVIYKINQ